MKTKWFAKDLLGCLVLLADVLFLAVLVLVLPDSGFAKMYEEPKSFSLKGESQEKVERKILPKIDNERLLAEDQARSKDPQHPSPHRFAETADVAFTLDNSGTWQTLADGRLWRLLIQSPGAKSLSLGITRFDMPDGAKLWIYDPRHKHVEGPYTARHRSRHGRLWTPIIEGDEIMVEVFMPAGVALPVIEIGKVNQGYRDFTVFEKDVPGGATKGACENKVSENNVPGAGTEGACEIDVVCSPEGDPWRKQIRAVGLYTVKGNFRCTGTLMNNTAGDHTPYFLSAYHCGVNDKNDDSVVVYWNYQSATCGTHGPGPTTDNQTGSKVRSSYDLTNFLLLELDEKPDPGFNVFYSGWDATDTTPPGTVGIHHPWGDVKAISLSNSPPDTTAYGSTVHDPSGDYWCVLWNLGATETGSSGSCLFETTNGRCIGQLYGGKARCDRADMHDWYGRLSASWDGGGRKETRLKDWLDNAGTGALTNDGYSP